MRIKKIEARGFIGIKKGLGLDDISLDMAHLNGLVALSGANGGGKTSFLELLHPYRTLASRSRALQHHVYLRDAYKDLTFATNGDTYRTLVKIDSQSGKQEGYVWRNGEPQVDGKATSYDEYIEDLFGSPDLFFASVFAAQGSKKLNELTTGQLKSLMSEFLRLDELMQYEQTSKAIASRLTAESNRARDQVGTIETELNEKQIATEQLVFARMDLEALQEKRHEILCKITNLETFREKLSRSVAAADSAKAHRDKLAEDLKQAEAEHASAWEAYGKADRELSEEITGVKKRIFAARQVAAKKDSIAKAEGLKAEAQKKLNVIEPLLSETSKQLECARADYQQTIEFDRASDEVERKKIEDLTSAVRAVEEQLAKNEAEYKMLTNQLETYHNPKLESLRSTLEYTERQASDLKLRDPACTSETCGFIQSAIQAEKQLPELRAKVEYFEAAAAEGKKEIRDRINQTAEIDVSLREDLAAKSQALFNAKSKLIEIKGKRNNSIKALSKKGCALAVKREELQDSEAKIKVEICGYDSTLWHKDKIAAAEKEASMLEDQLADLETRQKKLSKNDGQRFAQINARIQSIKTDIEAQNQALSEAEKGRTMLVESTRNLAKAQEMRSSVERQIEKQGRTVAVLEAEAKKVPGLKQELEAAKADVARLDTAISEWTYLKIACGANGLRALEIDSVAPLVTGISNDLLLSTFGPGHTLRFRTQDDEGRECLDILAIREDGEEVLLDNLSGGQKVWSLKALRLALTLLAKEKSGKLFYTAFADEEDGALDVTRAQDFIRLYRAFMQAGGFETCLYISHKPECVAMADHVLTFRRGGIEVE